MKTTTLPLGNSVRGLLLIPLILVCFALSPTVQAVTPPPDGGYPNGNTAEGNRALFSLTDGQHNTADGYHTLHDDTGGSDNTATGFEALAHNVGLSGGEFVAGNWNVAIGSQALRNNFGGISNTAVGYRALFSNTGDGFGGGGSNTAVGAGALLNNNNTPNSLARENTAIGAGALGGNTTGSVNIALGQNAGVNLTTGDNNIDIGNEGVAAESNTIRIGGDIGFGPQTATFIAGIRSVTTLTGTQPVVIDTNGQLGVGSNIVVSSNSASPSRFKHEMKAMKATVAELKSLVAKQQATIAQEQKDFRATAAQQRKEIKALTANLKEQALQIQKVSAQVEVSRPAPQTVLNNQ